jgi:endonuclease YncB( thermonuclease family)
MALRWAVLLGRGRVTTFRVICFKATIWREQTMNESFAQIECSAFNVCESQRIAAFENHRSQKRQRVRMVDYDAPEIGEPKCSSEHELGQMAKYRLLELLNSGAVAAIPRGDRDIDKYGRKLRLVTVNGLSVGGYLIGEGLAVPWAGRRHHWCG